MLCVVVVGVRCNLVAQGHVSTLRNGRHVCSCRRPFLVIACLVLSSQSGIFACLVLASQSSIFVLCVVCLSLRTSGSCCLGVATTVAPSCTTKNCARSRHVLNCAQEFILVVVPAGGGKAERSRSFVASVKAHVVSVVSDPSRLRWCGRITKVTGE